jgi:hypothetical protein
MMIAHALLSVGIVCTLSTNANTDGSIENELWQMLGMCKSNDGKQSDNGRQSYL